MKLSDFEALSEAELQVIDAHRNGVPAILYGGERPVSPSVSALVRPELIIYLALGGCDALRVDARGVIIHGAFVAEFLSFENLVLRNDISLFHCVFAEGIDFDDAQAKGIFLAESHTSYFRAQRLRAETLQLNRGFVGVGQVDLAGAKIAGQLACDGGHFLSNEPVALRCNSIEVGEAVHLSDGFQASNRVEFVSARIGQGLHLQDAVFEADSEPCLDFESCTVGTDVSLQGAEIRNDADFSRMSVGGGFNLSEAFIGGEISLSYTVVRRELFLRDLETQKTDAEKFLDLENASVGTLSDNSYGYDPFDGIYVQNFAYRTLETDMSVDQRINLFRKARRKNTTQSEILDGVSIDSNGDAYVFMNPWGFVRYATDFDPQPFLTFARYLADAGQRSQSVQVLIEKENRRYEAEYWQRWSLRKTGFGAAMQFLAFRMTGPVRFLSKWAFGYLYAPARVVPFVAGIIFLSWLLYLQVWNVGHFAPNTPIILGSDAWLSSVAEFGTTKQQLLEWSAEAGKDYESFNAFLYAVDLFVPLDALGQENAWRPSFERGYWGEIGYWARFPIQLSGWVITAVGAAVVTGLVGRRD